MDLIQEVGWHVDVLFFVANMTIRKENGFA